MRVRTLSVLLALLALAVSGCTTFTAEAGPGDEVVLRATFRPASGESISVPSRVVVGETSDFGATFDRSLVNVSRGATFEVPIEVYARKAEYGPLSYRFDAPRAEVEQQHGGMVVEGEVLSLAVGPGSYDDFEVLEIDGDQVRLRRILEEDSDVLARFGSDLRYRVEGDDFLQLVIARPGARFTVALPNEGAFFGLPVGRYVALDNQGEFVRFARIGAEPRCAPGAPALLLPVTLGAAPGKTADATATPCNLNEPITYTWNVTGFAGFQAQGPSATLAVPALAQDAEGERDVATVTVVATSTHQRAQGSFPAMHLLPGESNVAGTVDLRVMRVESSDGSPTRALPDRDPPQVVEDDGHQGDGHAH